MNDATALQTAAQRSPDRHALWGEVIDALGIAVAAEVGVWRGEFAEHLLRACPSLSTYYLIDPWRHLADWNKPWNVGDDEFRAVREEALRRTAFASERRRVLEGTTAETADRLRDRELDFCYVDGDHTLRGVMIDLIRLYPKVRDGGILAGDDFVATGWQHGDAFEPSLVYPVAVDFAEAVGACIYGLPHGQFAIAVDRSRDAFAFRDLTGGYHERTVQAVLRERPEGLVRRTLRRIQSG